MSLPVQKPTFAQIRWAVVVGPAGADLGLDTVPGVVWAEIVDHDPSRASPWVPVGHAYVQVWVRSDPGRLDRAATRIWRCVADHAASLGVRVVLSVRPAGWWARLRAWCRINAWGLGRWIRS